MGAGDYIEGVALFGVMLAACVGGAHVIVQGRLAELRGALRAVALALVATLAILAVHIVPAALGLLARGSVLVAAAAWLALAWRFRGSGAAPEPADEEPAGVAEEIERSRAAGRGAWALAALALGLVAALALAILRDHLAVPSGAIDVLNFHLPNVARWIESGSLWQIDVFLPDVAPGHYPNNGDVILLAAVLPWHNDFLAHLAMYPYWALTGVAVFVLARELGAARPAAILAAALVLVTPAVASPALIGGLVDSVMLFGFATGLTFLARHARDQRPADLVLAGLALGLAFGTKWYGVWAVAIAVAIWGAGMLADGRGWRTVARGGLVLGGLIALAGGIWLVRNLVESGNPVFPVEVAPLGIEIFPAPHDAVREAAGFTILDYVGEWDVWDEFILPQLRHTLAGPALVIVLGGALALGILALRRAVLSRPRALVAAIVAALLLALAYAITPYSAGGPEGAPVLVAADARYAVPALLVAAVALAAALRASAPLTLAVGVAALVALVDGARWSAGATNEAAGIDPLTWGAAIALTVGALVAWPRAAPRLPRSPRVLLGAAAAVAALAALAGYAVQREFNDGRYLGADPVVDGLVTAAGPGDRIGLAGVWSDNGISPVLPAFGSRYDREVSYVGELRDEMLRRYESGAQFEAALARGGYDLLVVGRADAGTGETPEERWAVDAGYAPVAESERLILLAPASSAARHAPG